MAKKPTITTISSGYYSRTALNDNFTNIRDKFDNTLSLDGSTPNTMSADLDLGSNDILNGGVGNFSSVFVAGSQLVPSATLFTFEGTWLTATAYQVNDVVIDSGSTYLCLVAHTSGTFATDLAANKWVELIDSTAYLRVSNNLSDVASAATARTNLGLGTIATQASTAVDIDGGNIDGTTIGATTPAAGSFTTVNTTGLATLNSMNITGGTSGDILYHNGTSYVRLAKGTAGQLLEMNSGATAPAWASGGLQFISSTDLANDATCDFTGWGSLNYDYFVAVLGNVVPSVDAATLHIRTTADDATFDSGASDYQYASVIGLTTGATPTGSGSTGAAQVVCGGVGSDTGEDGVSGIVTVFHPHLAKRTQLRASLNYQGTDGSLVLREVSGIRLSAAAVTGVRFVWSSGNHESGTITLYGGRNA